MEKHQLEVGLTVYHHRTGLRGRVVELETYRYGLCLRALVRWDDQTTSAETARKLRTTPKKPTRRERSAG